MGGYKLNLPFRRLAPTVEGMDRPLVGLRPDLLAARQEAPIMEALPALNRHALKGRVMRGCGSIWGRGKCGAHLRL